MINKCNMKLNECSYKETKCNDTMKNHVKMDKCKPNCNKDYEEYNCGCNYSNKLKYNKCEEMTNECNYNETKCNNTMYKYVKMDKCKPSCNKDYKEYNYGCNYDNKKQNKTKYNMNNMCNMNNMENEDEIIYIDNEDLYMDNCTTYVSPMYDMYQMQYMGDFAQQYPTLDMPYMNCYIDQYPDVNDMWMNYCMMMQNMMQSMKKSKKLY